MHSSFDIFRLDNHEWNDAIKHHPKLNNVDPNLNYYEFSADFDNKKILRQFERLFILLKYKKAFKNHDIEVMVDNARTLSAKIYDINLFNKQPGTKCVYEKIEWQDENSNTITVSCIELGFNSDKSQSLIELRSILASHEMFNDNTKLEQLANKNNIKIIWCPKFHCKLNPIEGFLCYLKWFVRKWSDQDYNKLNN